MHVTFINSVSFVGSEIMKYNRKFRVQLKVIRGHDCVYSRTLCVYVLEIIYLHSNEAKSSIRYPLWIIERSDFAGFDPI